MKRPVAQVSAARDQRELRRIEETLQSKRTELVEIRAARKGCLEDFGAEELEVAHMVISCHVPSLYCI